MVLVISIQEEVNEAVKAVLVAFGAQFLTSANLPPSARPGDSPLHLLAQRATWKCARDLLFPLATVPSFRVAFALQLFSSIPPPFNASIAAVASVDTHAPPTRNRDDVEYLAEQAARDCRFAATRGVSLMEEVVVRARKLCRQVSQHYAAAAQAHLRSVSPDWIAPKKKPPLPPELPAVPASLVPTLLGLLETLAWATLIFDNGHSISWRVSSTMSSAFAEECIDAAARFQGLEYYNTHAPQLSHVHAAIAQTTPEDLDLFVELDMEDEDEDEHKGKVDIEDEDQGGKQGAPSSFASSTPKPQAATVPYPRPSSGGGEDKWTQPQSRQQRHPPSKQGNEAAASLALARAKAVAPRGGADLMLSLHWANALKIYMWRQVSVLQEAVDAGVPHPAGTRAAAVLAVDIVRRHYGTFGSLVQACTQAYSLLDPDAQMMLYFLVLHSTLGTFHILDILDELKSLQPELVADLMSPQERTATIQVSTGFVAGISAALRRLTRDSATSSARLVPTVGHPLAPHFTPTEAPRIWNHPLLDMAFDAFLYASVFSARVLAEQVGVPSGVPPILPSSSRTEQSSSFAFSSTTAVPPPCPGDHTEHGEQQPAPCGATLHRPEQQQQAPHQSDPSSPSDQPQPHLTVPRSEAHATRGKLRACAAALHDLTCHLPSLLSWRNARRVRQVQDEVARLDSVWETVLHHSPPFSYQSN